MKEELKTKQASSSGEVLDQSPKCGCLFHNIIVISKITDLCEQCQNEKYKVLSFCEFPYVVMLERIRTLLTGNVLSFMKPDNNKKLPIKIIDADVLSASNAKQFSTFIKNLKTNRRIVVQWLSIPVKCKPTVLSFIYPPVLEELKGHEKPSKERLFVNKLFSDCGKLTLSDHAVQVPSHDRSMIGLMVHENMHCISNGIVNASYLSALDRVVDADVCDKIAMPSAYIPLSYMASVVRTLGVSRIASLQSSIKPPSSILFTKLLAAHATEHCRASALADEMLNHRMTKDELIHALCNKNISLSNKCKRVLT